MKKMHPLFTIFHFGYVPAVLWFCNRQCFVAFLFHHRRVTDRMLHFLSARFPHGPASCPGFDTRPEFGRM